MDDYTDAIVENRTEDYEVVQATFSIQSLIYPNQNKESTRIAIVLLSIIYLY